MHILGVDPDFCVFVPVGKSFKITHQLQGCWVEKKTLRVFCSCCLAAVFQWKTTSERLISSISSPSPAVFQTCWVAIHASPVMLWGHPCAGPGPMGPRCGCRCQVLFRKMPSPQRCSWAKWNSWRPSWKIKWCLEMISGWRWWFYLYYSISWNMIFHNCANYGDFIVVNSG